MENNIYSDELYHYGRKGMKWGQNIFGKIKTAKTNHTRKKNLEKARAAKVEKAKAAAKAAEEAEKRRQLVEKGKISAKKMTNEELQSSITRLEAEKKYNNLVLDTSAGKRFANKFLNETLMPAATESAKELAKRSLMKYGSDALGLNEKQVKSAYEKMREQHDMSNWKRKMAENEDFHTRREQKLKDEAAKRAKDDAQKQVDDYNAQREKEYEKSRAKTEGQYHMKNEKEPSHDPVEPGKSLTARDTTMSSFRSNPEAQKAIELGNAWITDAAGNYLASTYYREKKD